MEERSARLILLSKVPQNAICAEIGVWKGEFSQRILEVTSPAKLHLIDPWLFQQEFPDRMYGGSVAKGQNDMDAIFEDVRMKFAGDDRVVFNRGKSGSILEEFADSYFDWVYIDGNHYYDFVMSDLVLSRSKVRPNGLICGDDFGWGAEYDFPVRRAVYDFAKAYNLEDKVEVINSQYIIKI